MRREEAREQQLFWGVAAVLAVLAIAIAVWEMRKNSSTKDNAAGKDFEQAILQHQAERVPKGWQVVTGTSAMDDAQQVQFQVTADEPIQTWHGRQRPELIISCKGHRLDTYVVTHVPARVESNLDLHTVRLRIDEDKPATERWYHSTDREALFSQDGQRTAKHLLTARRMLFEFVPFQSSPEVVHFDVAGLQQLAQTTSNGCNLR